MITGLVLAASLLFVWPIPHTISLRDLLLVACVGLFAWLAWRDRHTSFPREPLRIPFSLYLALSAWIVFVALVVTDEIAWALGEIKGQWLKATLALLAGGLLGFVTRIGNDARLALTVIGGVLLTHVLYVDYQALGSYWSSANVILMRVSGLAEGPDKSNYLTNILLYLLLAEVLVRIVSHKRFLQVGNVVLVAIAAIALLAVYAEAVRNGVTELIVVLSLAVMLVIRASNRKRRLAVAGVALALVAVVVVIGYLNMQKDKRWQTFLETVPIALDIERNKAWINEGMPQPRLASGETVDWSNYSRIARIRAGLSLMADRPLGVGFGRNAFGHAVEQKYGLRTSHSHSGIIDLGVGIGLPGVLLWLAFLGALLRIGYRGMRKTGNFSAFALLFLTTGYGFRMLVDSTIRDHMLQMFLFLAAFLAVVTAANLDSKTAPRD
jgi:O-antigen ligase